MPARGVGAFVEGAKGEGGATLQGGLDSRDDALSTAGADGEIEARDALEDGVAEALRHAAHQPDDAPGVFALGGAEESELAECFVLRLTADGTGVDDDDVGMRFVGGLGEAGIEEGAGCGLALADVHLATVGMKGKGFHGADGG